MANIPVEKAKDELAAADAVREKTLARRNG